MLAIEMFFIPLFLTILFVLIIYPCARKYGFIDHPCSRKQHESPTPPIGGLAIYLGALSTFWMTNGMGSLNIPFISAITLLVLVGAIDDHRGLSVKVRLTAQIVAALIMTEFADVKINCLGNILGSGVIHLEQFSTFFTVFAVVGGINAFNMIDGIDGLSSSSALFAIIMVAILGIAFNNVEVLNLSLIFLGAILGFLAFNLRVFGRKKALIFLGDSGSTLLGFTVCWLLIYSSSEQVEIISPSLVLWVIAMPLFDSICIMIRRVAKGRSPFSPDREHLHHILPMNGFSVNETLIIILSVTVLFASAAITSSLFFGVADHILFMTFLLCFSLFYWLMHNHMSAE